MPVISLQPVARHRRQQVLVGRVLGAGGVGMRHPDGRHAQNVGEDLVGQRAAEIGQHVGLLAARLLDRGGGELGPRILRVEPRRIHDHVARLLELDLREAMLVEMAAQRRQDLVRIGADHEAQLAVGDGAGRDGVDRPVGIAGLEGQDLEAVPAEHALDRRQRLLAPVRIDLRRALAGIDMGVGQRRAHRVGERLGPPFRHLDLAARVGDGGQRMRQDDAGIGQQAAPVARMMAALAHGELEVEVERAARAAEDGRPAMVEPRARPSRSAHRP